MVVGQGQELCSGDSQRISATKVTEQDVVVFLHDAGLSHLYRTGQDGFLV